MKIDKYKLSTKEESMPKIEVEDRQLSRTIVLSSTIDDHIVGAAIERILLINEEDNNARAVLKEYEERPITVIVNSDGGGVHAALALVGTFETSRTPIHTYVYGRAMSAGMLIALAGHVRYAHHMASYMYHELSFGNHGKIEQQRSDLEEFERLMKTIDRFILNRTDIDPKLLDKKESRDWYLTAQEALNYGICDYLIEAKYHKPEQESAKIAKLKPKKKTKAKQPKKNAKET